MTKWKVGSGSLTASAAYWPGLQRLAFTTEQLATRTNAVVAGLLTASCGNASELIISGLAQGGGQAVMASSSVITHQ